MKRPRHLSHFTSAVLTFTLLILCGLILGDGAPVPFGVFPISADARAAEQEDSLQIWIVEDSTKVRPNMNLGTPWGTTPTAPTLELEGAGGETVAFQIVLEGAAPSTTVEVRVGDLVGESTRINRDRIEIFLETYIDCPPVEAKIVSMGPGKYPDPLVPLWDAGPGTANIAHPLELPAKQRRVLWVDIRIPRGLRAGLYKGTIDIVPREQVSLQLPIQIEKYDFDISVQRNLDAWVPCYITKFMQREKIASLDTNLAFEVIWRYFRMAHQHRFVSQAMEYQPRLAFDMRTGALVSADWTAYDITHNPVLSGALFEDQEPPRIWKVGGFVLWGARPGDPPHFGGSKRDKSLTPAHKRALQDYAREIRRHFDAKGWTRSKLFMYMIDEPDLNTYPNFPDLIADYGNTIHDAGADIDHMVTIGPGVDKRTHGAVDIWAVWGAGYYPPYMEARQRLGERAWFYQKQEPFVGGQCLNHEGLAMRSWAWIAWRYKVDGIFLWVGNYWNEDPYRNAVNWNDDLLGNGVLFYPGAMLPTIGFPAVRGPVSSFRMKALRRGLLDYEYFHLLRSLGGDPDPIVKRIIRSALNEKGYDPIWNHPLWAKPGDWSHNPAEWDEARREVAREISKRLSQ